MLHSVGAGHPDELGSLWASGGTLARRSLRGEMPGLLRLCVADLSFAPLWCAEQLSIKGDQG